jgi:hypothetical protein
MEPSVNIFKQKEDWANYFGAVLRLAGYKEAGDYLIRSVVGAEVSGVQDKIDAVNQRKDFKPTLMEDIHGHEEEESS